MYLVEFFHDIYGEVKDHFPKGDCPNLVLNDEKIAILHETIIIDLAEALFLINSEFGLSHIYDGTFIPLDLVIQNGKDLDFIKFLLIYGADVNLKKDKGLATFNKASRRRDKFEEIIQKLLTVRVDIRFQNCKEYHNSLASFYYIDDYLYFTKLVIKYTLIMNFDESYTNISLIDEYGYYYGELVLFFVKCVCEIIQMKIDIIKDGLNLYTFITSNFNSSVTCYNELSKIFKNTSYKKKYHIYYDMILEKIKPFLDRADMLENVKHLQIYTELNKVNQGEKNIVVLDYYSTLKITEYLYNESLLNFIIAFDDQQNCN